MIRFSFLGVKFSLPLLTVLTPLLANKLGMAFDAFPMFSAMALHETGHILAAKALGIEIQEIKILPFGGSARMENPYTVNPLSLMIMAFCGPLINLSLVFIFSAMAQWGALAPAYAAGHVRVNLFLMMFNLCPVLPLDGGRILFSLLQRSMGQARALRFCIRLSRIFAIFLAASAIVLLFITGKLNLAFILTSVFIFSASQDEYDSLFIARTEVFHQKTEAPLPARFYQISPECSAVDAIRLMHPREASWFVVTGNEPKLFSGRDIIDGFRKAEARNISVAQLLACSNPGYQYH